MASTLVHDHISILGWPLTISGNASVKQAMHVSNLELSLVSLLTRLIRTRNLSRAAMCQDFELLE